MGDIQGACCFSRYCCLCFNFQESFLVIPPLWQLAFIQFQLKSQSILGSPAIMTSNEQTAKDNWQDNVYFSFKGNQLATTSCVVNGKA